MKSLAITVVLSGTLSVAAVLLINGGAGADGQTDSCVIKGNISRGGEHIYHVPGGKYYDRTRISTAFGERWFCSEAEARAAGWRHSKR